MSYNSLTQAYHTGSPEAVHSPVHGGIAVFSKVPGSSTVGIGTLSGVVLDRTSRKKYLLSNQHVFFPAGPAKGGLSVYMTGDQSKPIAKTYKTKAESNPWPKADKQKALDTIGTYHDSALATALVPVSNVVNNIGAQRGMIEPKAGMRIKFFGRTSRLQRGVIVKADVNNISDVGGGRITVQKHIITADIAAAPGDSGSMVFNDDNRVVGLHFASTDSGVKAMCRASAIEKAYNVVFSEDELSGGAPPVPTPTPTPTPVPDIIPAPAIQIPSTAEIIEFAKKNPLLIGAVGLGFITIMAVSAVSK